jgi:hypothetical protein
MFLRLIYECDISEILALFGLNIADFSQIGRQGSFGADQSRSPNVPGFG